MNAPVSDSRDYPTTTLLRRLLGNYVLPHRKKLLFALVCMGLVAATTALNAWMMQPVLDDIFLNKDVSMLHLVPLAIAVLALVKAGAQYGQSLVMRYVGQRIISDMQMQLFVHLLHADLAHFHSETSGRLISRFTNDITMLRNTLTNLITGVAREALSVVFLVGVMIYQSWQLSLIALGVFPLAVMPMMRLARRMRKLSDHTQRDLGHFTAQLDEVFQGVRIVKAYGREQYEIGRASSIVEGLFTLYFKASRLHAAASPMMEMLAGIAVAGVIWYGGGQVLEGATTPGAFFSFITAMIMAYRPVKSLSGTNANLQEGLAAAARLFATLDTEAAIRNRPAARALEIWGGEIRFDHVQFAYEAGKPALRDISLTIPAGKTVALVGHSGSGKSTILNLLLRFYEPQEGKILIDGQELREVTLASLRSAMALVTQETMLFDDTIRANILYGNPEASEQEMLHAAAAAAAHEFINALPEGYDTVIGQHGFKLSGGQRQRLAIARAMLRSAPILLLDEATSSLDPAAEKQIQSALHRLMKGRTTLVIAHRLSTVINADLIYVLSQGRVAESGTHAELLAMGGEYARLYAKYLESGSYDLEG